MCKWGTYEWVFCLYDNKPRMVDACISEEIKLLNALGVETVNSCCSHGKGVGTTLIEDASLELVKKLNYNVLSERTKTGWLEIELKTYCKGLEEVKRFHERNKDKVFFHGHVELYGDDKMEEECPHIKKMASGEDEYMNGCEVNEDRMCVLETGERCETWETIKREWDEEEANRPAIKAMEEAKLKPKTKMESYEYSISSGNVLIAKVRSILQNDRYVVEEVDFIVPGVNEPSTIPGGQLESFKKFVVKIYEMLEEEGCLEKYSK